MTREAFIEYLEYKAIDFQIEASGMIVITYDDYDLYLDHTVTEIPSGVEFRTSHQVRCSYVKVVNPNVIFNMQGKWGSEPWVWLPHAEKIYPGVEFHNNGSCVLKVFERERRANIKTFRDWKGNIKGIDSNKLLNAMIKQGMFI